MNNKINLFLATSISMFLSGCAGDPVALSKIVKDKKAYLNQHFAKQSVSEAVIKKLPHDDNASVITDSRLIFETKTTSGDKTYNKKEILSFFSLGDGLVQSETEYTSNDITTGYNFSLSYRGLNDVKWVYVSAAIGYSGMPYEIKEIIRWDNLGTKEGDVSTVDFKWGNVVQIVGYHDGQYKCTVTKLFKANELHSALSGQARELDCQTTKDGAVFLRSKYAYIVDLGFAIPIEATSANYKTEYKLVEINKP